jgi:acyl-CoA thioesterase-1
MFLLGLLLALVSTTGAVPAQSEVRRPSSLPRIVALGDSLTSGHGIGRDLAFPAVLQDKLAAAGFDFEIVNAGISGDTSTGALRRLSRALGGDVRVLIVAIGANDGLRGVPVATVKSNISQIIATAHERGISVVLCGMEALPIHGMDYSIAFHNAFADLAARYKVMFVPFLLKDVILDPNMLQPDRIHPNAAGARRIAENVWPYLETVLRALATQS